MQIQLTKNWQKCANEYNVAHIFIIYGIAEFLIEETLPTEDLSGIPIENRISLETWANSNIYIRGEGKVACDVVQKDIPQTNKENITIPKMLIAAFDQSWMTPGGFTLPDRGLYELNVTGGVDGRGTNNMDPAHVDITIKLDNRIVAQIPNPQTPDDSSPWIPQKVDHTSKIVVENSNAYLSYEFQNTQSLMRGHIKVILLQKFFD